MLYLIGGPPRCGKTLLATRLSRERHVPIVPLDLLWSIAETAHTEWREPMPKGVDRIPEAARLFRPYLEIAAKYFADRPGDAVIEGELIRPMDVVDFSARYPTRPVFLLRGRVAPVDLLRGDAGGSWLAGKPPELVSAVADEIRAYSARLATECTDLRLPFVDVSDDLDGALTVAIDRLDGGMLGSDQ